jgi:hypothetical protein
MAVRIAGTLARNSFLSLWSGYLASGYVYFNMMWRCLPSVQDNAGKVKRTLFVLRPERIKNDHAKGFSAGDAKPRAWMHKFPWVSFRITGT